MKREDLFTHSNKLIPAACNYCVMNETFKLEYDGCLGMFCDVNGNIWVNAERRLYKIDNRENKAFHFPEQLTSIPCKGIKAIFL